MSKEGILGLIKRAMDNSDGFTTYPLKKEELKADMKQQNWDIWQPIIFRFLFDNKSEVENTNSMK